MAKLTVGEVDAMRAAPTENRTLEFKEAKDSFDRSELKKYCIAIANELGGTLLLGVHDKTRAVTGTKAFPNVQEQEHWLLQTCGFRVEAEEIAHPDGRVVAFRIPSRPKGTAYEDNGRYYMRSGSSLVGMTEDQLRKIFAEHAPPWSDAICREVNADEAIEFLDTQTFFQLFKLPYPTTPAGVVERLQKNRLVEAGAGGRVRISRLAVLLLAKKLEEFPEISRRAPRVVVYNGKTKLSTKLDQTGTLGYAVGFTGLIRFITLQMPRREVVKDGLRSDELLVPEIVIRELVANALVHQDLTLTGTSPMIEIYDDRIEISNPGKPIVDANRFIDGYRSRNETLAELMRRFGICEEKGSGIDRVITAAEESHLSAPDIGVGDERTHVIVFGPRDVSEMTMDERVRAAYQHCSLKWVRRDHMTNQSLRMRFQLGEDKTSTVSQIITATIDAGLVRTDQSVGGSKRFARYVPFWA